MQFLSYLDYFLTQYLCCCAIGTSVYNVWWELACLPCCKKIRVDNVEKVTCENLMDTFCYMYTADLEPEMCYMREWCGLLYSNCEHDTHNKRNMLLKNDTRYNICGPYFTSSIVSLFWVVIGCAYFILSLVIWGFFNLSSFLCRSGCVVLSGIWVVLCMIGSFSCHFTRQVLWYLFSCRTIGLYTETFEMEMETIHINTGFQSDLQNV